MEKDFKELINSLQLSPLPKNGLYEIKCILEKQNSELSSLFISQLYQSILTLEHWAWQLLSQNSYQWIEEPNYVELFHTLGLFNKHLVFNYDDIQADMKGSLLIPEENDRINGIFKHLEKMSDENDRFIAIVSLWFDNLSYFLHDNPEFEMSPTVIHINRQIARNYIMTDQYKFYLTQLRQSSLSESLFTAKQLFYIKTCSLSLSSYLFAKAQDFVYTAEEIVAHFGPDYVQIIMLRTYTIESWSPQLLTCIANLLIFFSSCCWWGGEKGTQAKMAFTNKLEVCEYIDALVRIIDCKPLYQFIVPRRANDQTILLNTALFSLLNVAQHEDFIWFLRSKVLLPDTLLTIATTSTCDHISLCVYVILGEILNDERLKELKISDSASIFFLDMLEQAWKHPSKKYKQVPIFFFFRGLINLSKIDAIQQKVADTNKVSLLIEMCDQYPIVFDILWALSFNRDIQQQLRLNSSFITKLIHNTKECDNAQMRKTTHGILWNLQSDHEDRTVSEKDGETIFDIMISYSHKDEIICRKIYEALVSVGYSVWIDFDQMHGNVMDAMAEAIERSKTILICMSEQYRKSNYCRAEAHYAFQRQLRIIPVLLQEHYQPDGWLLFLIGQLLYINFTKYEFLLAMEVLIKELKAPKTSDIGVIHIYPKEQTNIEISSTPKPLSLLTLPDNILNWTQTHVQNWLINHGLLQLSHLFANFDGRSLLYMNEFIENVELQQVVSLLQEDSLRRTNQNLSLVELSYFRSLMDQQKRPSNLSLLPIYTDEVKKTKNHLFTVE